jgi:hypothetical protein
MRLRQLLKIVGILPLLAASAGAQVMVTTPANAGPGSLREAIGTAAVGDKILFAAPMTINLTSPIVVGVDNLIIEACYPSVTLNASALFPGLEFSAVTGCEVRGLRMEGFSPALGFRNGSSGNKVGGTNPCHKMELHNGGLGIALSDSGTILNEFLNVEVRHNLYEGIYLRNGASQNRFGDGSLPGAVCSHDNGLNGVLLEYISGVVGSVSQNEFLGCLIGTDITGYVGSGNALSGVTLRGFGVTNNLFSGCVLSGNLVNGLSVDGGASLNTVKSCLVGVDVAGLVAVPNDVGVDILNGFQNSISVDNVISGNLGHGIRLRSSSSYQNNISENKLGPDVTGSALGNGEAGIALLDGAWENEVFKNHISSNGMDGVFFEGNDPHHNLIIENLVGTDSAGGVAMPNGRHGVMLQSVATENQFVGNVISGNTSYGVVVGFSSDRNSFKSNTIGLDIARVNSVQNNLSGMIIFASETEVGGATLNEGNCISGNGAWGVILRGDALSNAVLNRFSANMVGMPGLGNGFGGFKLMGYVFDTVIGAHVGSTSTSLGNSILENGGPGVLVGLAGGPDPTDGVQILNNSISDNVGDGIELAGLGNAMIPAPLITAATSSYVGGYITVGATPCLVQVFRDSDDEGYELLGEQFVGSAYGTFSIAASLAPGDRVTATQTTHVGGMTPWAETSPFSSVMTAVEVGGPGCFCTAAVAPCGNADPNAGCSNSTGFGASLRAHGSRSVSDDNLTLSAERLPAGVFTMLLASRGAAMIPFGDGLLCVNPGSRIWRLQVANSRPWGATVYGDGLVAKSLLLPPGAAINSGDTWSFQALYRDVAGPCGTGRNLTNSVKIGFTP